MESMSRCNDRPALKRAGSARIRGLFVACAIAAAVVAQGCGSSPRPEAKVLMICVDGLEMSVMGPMLERGELPVIASLVDRGVCGHLETIVPAESPVVWTTVATGKPADEHGVTGFLDERSGGPFTSNARKTKAFWNIADDYGLSCNLVGYWNTWPAESIEGTVVTQFSATEQARMQNMVKGSFFKDLEDATWPPGYAREIRDLAAEAARLERIRDEVILPVFGDPRELNLPVALQDLMYSCYWSFEADAVYHAVAARLFEESPADINVVYLGGPDVIAHRFWRYREPELYSYEIPEDHIAAFGGAIERYYRIVDRIAGELIGAFDEDVRVLILSDHGMHAEFLDGTTGGQPTPLSAHHLDGPPGILIAAGPGIATGGGVDALTGSGGPSGIGTVYDIAPTLLYLLDLPVGRDMRLGRVLKNVLAPGQLEQRPVEHVESHDVGFRASTPSRRSDDADREFRKRMEKLGYI